MMLHPLDVEPFVPTPKKPGDIVIHGHASYRVQQDGSWEASDASCDLHPEPLYGPRTTPMWCWAVMGVGLALLGLWMGGVI